jgi:hypothetical protein
LLIGSSDPALTEDTAQGILMWIWHVLSARDQEPFVSGRAVLPAVDIEKHLEGKTDKCDVAT